jgi:hypothetical protein
LSLEVATLIFGPLKVLIRKLRDMQSHNVDQDVYQSQATESDQDNEEDTSPEVE